MQIYKKSIYESFDIAFEVAQNSLPHFHNILGLLL